MCDLGTHHLVPFLEERDHHSSHSMGTAPDVHRHSCRGIPSKTIPTTCRTIRCSGWTTSSPAALPLWNWLVPLSPSPSVLWLWALSSREHVLVGLRRVLKYTCNSFSPSFPFWVLFKILKKLVSCFFGMIYSYAFDKNFCWPKYGKIRRYSNSIIQLKKILETI